MSECLICKQKAKSTQKGLLLVEVECPVCGHYHYEKAFKTSYDFFLSQQDQKDILKITKQMKKLVKSSNVCFVDDFESIDVEGCILYELIDVLNPIGIQVAHNNTIDSNYKD